MRVLLKIRSGSSAGKRVQLAHGQPLHIGRRADADHSFPDDKAMSGVHFSIQYDDKGCRLLDLNSSNGTFLNGSRIKEATLANGDEIRAGNTIFVVCMMRDDAVAPEPPRSEPPRPDLSKPESAPTFTPPARPEPTPALPPQRRPAQPLAPPAPAPLKPGELPSFPVRPPQFMPESVAPPEPRPKPPAPAQPRLQDLLAKHFQPLYALLDASREPSVLKVILESKEEHQSLYEGAQGAQLAHFAPYLIRIPQLSPLIDTLAKQAWSKSWGVFVTSDLPLKELRTHFRHYLNVKLPDGQQVYFRYYDPRVLRLFLPTCLPEEANQFFGPVKHFFMEAEDPNLALHFTRSPKGAAGKELQLAPA
jgi:Domain of unknown function (DUF4123)/FHA domain